MSRYYDHSPLRASLVIAALGLVTAPTPSPAQSTVPDTVHLGLLYEIAERGDPRDRQFGLQDRVTDLTLETLSAQRRPQLDLSATATYQTETASIPIDASAFPLGSALPTPPRDQYEVAAEIRQLLYDGGRLAHEGRIQRTRRTERAAAIRSSLYGLRGEINTAFFAVLVHQEERAQLDVLADDLEARRRLVSVQARDGLALPSDEAELEAELVNVRQRVAAAEAARRAALRRLEYLSARAFSAGDVLATPDLEREAKAAAAQALESTASGFDLAETSARPEFERFEAARERARTEAAAFESALKPRLTAFARLAVGRPGFDFFDDRFRPYGMLGLRAQWQPFDWGTSTRQAEATRLQAELIAADETAFANKIKRDVLDAVYAIERLESALVADEHVLRLRERVERAARRQLEEGVLLAADYVQKRNDVFEAGLQRSRHRVELAEARVRLLTMVGVEIPGGADGLRTPVAPAIPFEASLIDQPSQDQ